VAAQAHRQLTASSPVPGTAAQVAAERAPAVRPVLRFSSTGARGASCSSQVPAAGALPSRIRAKSRSCSHASSLFGVLRAEIQGHLRSAGGQGSLRPDHTCSGPVDAGQSAPVRAGAALMRSPGCWGLETASPLLFSPHTTQLQEDSDRRCRQFRSATASSLRSDRPFRSLRLTAELRDRFTSN